MTGDSPKSQISVEVDEFNFDGDVVCYHGWRASRRIFVGGDGAPKRFFRCPLYENEDDKVCSYMECIELATLEEVFYDSLELSETESGSKEDNNTEEPIRK
ncbi:unnamed protein product [Linum trigynum]|uniref:Uncharacterized protein n=1 Tax=Linum trigynum TaxID=586398 RepID=A0AAV2DU39_9ROSI